MIRARWQGGGSRKARRAGFPHGLVFCLAALGMISQNFPILEEETGPGFVLAMGLVILFWVTIIGAVGWSLWVAYRAHWPGWSASWYGYALALGAVPVLGWLQNSDAATRGGWDQVFFGEVLPAILIGWLLVMVWIDAVKVLLLATPFAILFWIPVGEFLPALIRNPLNLWMLAVLAGVAVVVVGGGIQKIHQP